MRWNFVKGFLNISELNYASWIHYLCNVYICVTVVSWYEHGEYRGPVLNRVYFSLVGNEFRQILFCM